MLYVSDAKLRIFLPILPQVNKHPNSEHPNLKYGSGHPHAKSNKISCIMHK